MQVELSAEQRDFVRRAVESGRVRDDAQAVEQAMTLWVAKERRLAELRDSLDAAEASLARGEGNMITADGMRTLARAVMDRCAERLTIGPSGER